MGIRTQSRTVEVGTNNQKLQADNTLITYARYRTQKTKSWLSSFYPYSPGSLRSSVFVQRDSKQPSSSFTKLLIFLLFGFMLFPPYITLLFGMGSISYIFFSDPSPDLYTLLFMIYCNAAMLLFILNYHKLLYFVRARESKKYIERQGLDYAYKSYYFSLILAFLSVSGLPFLFILALSDTSFVSQTSIDMITQFLLLISVSLFFFIVFDYGLELLRVWRNFSTCMHTSFGSTSISVKGKIHGEKYSMIHSISEVHSFVLLKTQNPLLLLRPDTNLSKREFEGVTLLYLINKFGYANLSTYYVQGDDAVQELLALLTKQYPDVHIRLIGFADDNEDNEIEIDKVLHEYRSVANKTVSFEAYEGIRTPFFFPRFISHKENKTKSLPDSNGKEVPHVAISGMINEINDADTSFPPIFKKENNYILSYFLRMLISTFVCFSFMLITLLFCPPVITAFSLLMTCFTPFLPPGKRWYHPGINSLPACLIILLLFFCIIL